MKTPENVRLSILTDEIPKDYSLELSWEIKKTSITETWDDFFCIEERQVSTEKFFLRGDK